LKLAESQSRIACAKYFMRLLLNGEKLGMDPAIVGSIKRLAWAKSKTLVLKITREKRFGCNGSSGRVPT
jgi:hypothetical protein